MNRPIRRIWVILILIVSACGTADEPTSVPTLADTATPNEIVITPDATRLSRELPPTWTPTHTPTITLTPTPSATFTVTPSLTPVDFDLLCEDFIYSLPSDGETYGQGDVLPVSYGISPDYSYAFVGVVFEHDAVVDAIADIVPGGREYTARYVISDFPASGRWDYRVGAFLINGDDILCREDGYFLIEEGAVRAERPNTIPTARPVPSVTPPPEPTHELCYLFC